MIEKAYIIRCDWCGKEHRCFCAFSTKAEALKSYSEHFLLYRYKNINPLADALFEKQCGRPCKNFMFCCEECSDEFFKESPEYRPHYELVKKK